MKKKVLIYIADEKDALFAKNYLEKNKNKYEIIIAAPSTPARLYAERFNIPHKTYDYLNDNIDINFYQQLLSIINNFIKSDFCNKNYSFLDYNLFEIYINHFIIIFSETLSSYQFVNKILIEEQPNFLLISDDTISKKNIYLSHFYPYGLESLIITEIAKINKIQYKKYRFIRNKVFCNSFFYYINHFIKYPNHYLKPLIKKFCITHLKSFNNISDSAEHFSDLKDFPYKKTIALYIYGDYYFEQFLNVILELQKKTVNILICCLDNLSTDQEKILTQYNNIKLIYFHQFKDLFFVPKNLPKKTIQFPQLSADQTYNQILKHVIQIFINQNTANTIKHIKLNEMIIKKFHPTLLYSHFHDNENIFPYIKNKIPTILGTHGFSTYYNLFNRILCAEYVSSQNSFSTFFLKKLPFFSNNIIKSFDNRYIEIYKEKYDKNILKKQLSLPTNKKICLFCSGSVAPIHVFGSRHNFSYFFIKYAEKLAHLYPEVHFVFRVHHGLDNKFYISHIKYLNLPNLKFSISPDPIFSELVKCADLVISQYSSSIIESLLQGIPVIYDYSNTTPCSDLLTIPNIYPVNSFDDIQKQFIHILNNPKEYTIIKEEIKSFLKQLYYIETEDSNIDNLIKFILSLSNDESKITLQSIKNKIEFLSGNLTNIVQQYINNNQ